MSAGDLIAWSLAAVLAANSVRAVVVHRPPGATNRVAAYRKVMARDWAFTTAVAAWWVLSGWSARRVYVGAPQDGWGFTLTTAVELAVLLALSVVFIRRHATDPRLQARATRLFRYAAAVLPRTRDEQVTFVGVALTAGVCEEVVFRGFLLAWLNTGPLHLSLGVAVALTAVTFGLAHTYQGPLGILTTAIAGVVFANLATTTHSLLLPVMVHALVDLRAIFLAPLVPEGSIAAFSWARWWRAVRDRFGIQLGW